MNKWRDKLNDAIGPESDRNQFAQANVDAIYKAIEGVSAHSGRSNAESGVHAVVNISSAHIPAFCRAAKSGDKKPYKNYYDLGKNRVGELTNLTKREKVDQCLPLGPRGNYKNIYFCAAELNGTGVRYYGDFCFVLKSSSLAQDTVFLDRNSFEFFLPPLYEDEDTDPAAEMSEHSGTWEPHLKLAAALKILELGSPPTRRLTTGQISETLLLDEDYLEALKKSSFGPSDILESRTTAADASLEALIAERIKTGPVPAPEDLLWMTRRRSTAHALQRAGCKLRVVTTPGKERR